MLPACSPDRHARNGSPMILRALWEREAAAALQILGRPLAEGCHSALRNLVRRGRAEDR